MTSIFSSHFQQEQLTEADIKALEDDFHLDDKEYENKIQQQTQKNDTYYKEQTDLFKTKPEYVNTWNEIKSIHEASSQNELLENDKYIFKLFIELLFPPSPKKIKFIEYINNIKNNTTANRNLNSLFNETTKKPATSKDPIKFLGKTQGGGAVFFLVDDIVKLNDNGINWCEMDQQNCSHENDKFENFSNMLFRFIEYKNDDCEVKLIHPHDLYEQWGGEDSDNLIFPEKYLKNK